MRVSTANKENGEKVRQDLWEERSKREEAVVQNKWHQASR
jgi:hypothetical protein